MADPVDTSGFADPYNYYKQAASNAMPSPESLDRSAARLRSANDTQYNATGQKIQDEFAHTGRSNSGAYDYARTMNDYGRQQSYSTGYNNMLDDYQKNVMTGATNLGTIAGQYGNTLGTAQDLNVKARQNEIAQQGADAQTYQGKTDRATQTSKALNDFLTFMGTFGNTTGNGQFNDIFSAGKLGFMNLLGMPSSGTTEQPSFGGFSY